MTIQAVVSALLLVVLLSCVMEDLFGGNPPGEKRQ